MSKETTAAILTRVYFEKSPGSQGGLEAHAGLYSIGNVERIGHVYGAFLARLDLFELWEKPDKESE